MYNKGDLHKADGFDSDSTGFAAGLEYAVNEDVKAGVGYAFTTTDIDTARSKTDVDTHTGFVYGEYKPENLYVNGTLSFGRSKYDETTRLTESFPKSRRILSAWRFSASIERSSGVFLSSACPPYEQKAVGMQSVFPFINA